MIFKQTVQNDTAVLQASCTESISDTGSGCGDEKDEEVCFSLQLCEAMSGCRRGMPNVFLIMPRFVQNGKVSSLHCSKISAHEA